MIPPIRRVAVACLIYAIFCLLAGVLITEMTLHPQRRRLDVEGVDHVQEILRRYGANLHDVSLRTPDGITLDAWLIQPEAANGNAVILLHGLGDNRLGQVGYAELLLAHRYTILMPDARAHGQSQGAIASYGLLERGDIRDWVHWLEGDLHPKCIYGFAESMGAAQLLQAVEDNRLFCAVAAESPFSNFREIAYDRIGQFFYTGPWLGRTLLRPVVEFAFLYSNSKYHLDLTSASPELAVSHTSTPVLLIHGQVDRNIPVRHSRRIRALAPTIPLWEVPDADHCGAISVAREEFETSLLNWFSAHPSPSWTSPESAFSRRSSP